MYCPNCGAKNEDGSNFCEQCGHPLSRATKREPHAVPHHPIPEQKKKAQAESMNRVATSTPLPLGEKLLVYGSRALLALSILVTSLFIISLSAYKFSVRDLTDDDYWGPDQHWVCVDVYSPLIPSAILYGHNSTITPTREVPSTIEKLKPKAEQRYLENTKAYIPCGLGAIAASLIFMLYVKKIRRR